MGLLKWVACKLGIEWREEEEHVMVDSLPSAQKPFVIYFNRVSEKLAPLAAEFLYHDTKDDQLQQDGYRCSTAILLTADGRVAVNVSVCSPADNFSHGEGRVKAIGLTRKNAVHNLYVGYIDIMAYDGSFRQSQYENGDACYIFTLPRERVKEFFTVIKEFAAAAKRRAILQVHINRKAVEDLKKFGRLGVECNIRPLSQVMAVATLQQKPINN